MLSPYRATLVSTRTSGIPKTTSSSMVPRTTRTTSSPSMRRIGRSTTTSPSHLFLRSCAGYPTSRRPPHIRAGTLALGRHSSDSLCCPSLLVLRLRLRFRARATPTRTPTRGLRGSRRSHIHPHHRSKQSPQPPRLQPSAPAGPPPPSPPSHLSARPTLRRRRGRLACRWATRSASTLRCPPLSTRQATTRGSAPVRARLLCWRVIMMPARTTRTTWGRGSRSRWRCFCVVDRAPSLFDDFF
ncbi:hypothetical protein B0H16DRAFT_1606938 [Mycena metata]|uniref:Uncharacterized protein n=1 Tax=Mycena metata TaxID=1033252 RepID=A0AAD7HFG5_9AGAR|nr:hypothetical protein B0H16DRAFT_1606938 [Mycena metata]